MLWSCAYKKTDKRFQQGENKVPKDTFELILYDVHLADAIVTSQIIKSIVFSFHNLLLLLRKL